MGSAGAHLCPLVDRLGLEALAGCTGGLAVGRSLPTSLPLDAAPGHLSHDAGWLF